MLNGRCTPMRGRLIRLGTVVLFALAGVVLPGAKAFAAGGQLYAFGDNYFGQLGSPTSNGTSEPNPTPTQVTLPGASGPVTQIAAGALHSLALTSTGQLYAFGENDFGQLGITANVATYEPNPSPTLVTLPGASGPVTQIAAGGYHSLAVTSSGQLYAFGENAFGQLGITANVGTSEPNPSPTLVSLPGASGPVTQMAAGALHSLAVTSSGQLYAFGANEFGQLGITANNGTWIANPTPTQVTLPGPAQAVGAGSEALDTLVSTAGPMGPAPTVTKLLPRKGPAAGLTTVTITGANFLEVAAVRFGSIAAAGFTVKSSTSITAVSPPGTTGTVDVTVTTPNGLSGVTASDHFMFEAPEVASVSPSTGSKAGGYLVTAKGSGYALGAATTFKVGKALATSVNCTSSAECTMIFPAAAKAGTVDVRATVNKKTSRKALVDHFAYT
jgi:hypothetical protein